MTFDEHDLEVRIRGALHTAADLAPRYRDGDASSAVSRTPRPVRTGLLALGASLGVVLAVGLGGTVAPGDTQGARPGDRTSASAGSCTPMVSGEDRRRTDGSTTTDVYYTGADCSRRAVAAADERYETSPTLSPDGTRVGFVEYAAEPAGADLVVVDLQSGQRRVVHSSPHGLYEPSWSPDGRAFALSEADGHGRVRLSIVSSSGAGPRPLSPEPSGSPGMMPSWSPDGTRIAFSRSSPTGARLVVHNLRTGEQAVVPTGPGPVGRSAWSPDGRHLAALRAGTTDGAGIGREERQEVVVLSTTGWDVRDDRLLPLPFGPATSVGWSEDGLQVAVGRATAPGRTTIRSFSSPLSADPSFTDAEVAGRPNLGDLR